MIKLGITGGIGSGKSIVSRILQHLDYPVYISDERAKQLMISDQYIIESLTDLLGSKAYIDGELNKACIGGFLFASPENGQIINSIIHPRVRYDFESWCSHHQDKELVGFESAILFEANFRDTVDKTLLVYAPEETRISRAIARDNSTEELIIKRIRAQASDEWKRELADFVIINDNHKALLPQVFHLLENLLKSNK